MFQPYKGAPYFIRFLPEYANFSLVTALNRVINGAYLAYFVTIYDLNYLNPYFVVTFK